MDGLLFAPLFAFANSKSPVSREHWETFERTFRVHTVKKKDLLVRPGESADRLFFVLEGVVRNYFHDRNGREYTKIFRGPGGLIGSYAERLRGEKSRYSIEACLPARVVEFSYSEFENRMVLSHEWANLGRIIAEENYLEKEKREYMLLHMDIAEKFSEFSQDFLKFRDELPQNQIASYLGVSPEALNRYLKKPLPSLPKA